MATEVKLITAEEFMHMPELADGSRLALVRGEIVMLPPPGFEHGFIQLGVGSLLRQFVRTNRLGRVTVESGVLTERDPDTVRGPDVAYWSAERLPLDQPAPQGYPDAAPDLCVEVLSPSNRAGEIRDKVREYLNRGVRMVWVLDPEHRTVTVYRSADEGRVLHETATLSGEDVLPGFSCRVVELFE